jgi:hypothetical protein
MDIGDGASTTNATLSLAILMSPSDGARRSSYLMNRMIRVRIVVVIAVVGLDPGDSDQHEAPVRPRESLVRQSPGAVEQGGILLNLRGNLYITGLVASRSVSVGYVAPMFF